MNRVKVLEEAARDIEQGWDFYDGILDGLGDRLPTKIVFPGPNN